MLKLNLPPFEFSIKSEGQSTQIFDSYRKKYVELTPEEWVRQNFLKYLSKEKNYPEGLIAVEMEIRVGKLKKRCDAVVYSRDARPILIMECKAPKIKITQDTFDQASRYNVSLNVDYLIITNGFEHYCCKINSEKKSLDFIKEVPDYFSL